MMRNFSLANFILFVGAAIVGLAALSAAGFALGLALAGAAVLAMLVLFGWIVVSNLRRRNSTPPREPPHPRR